MKKWKFSRPCSERGELTLGGMLFLLLIIAGGYVGYKLAVPQIRSFQVKEIFRNEVARLKTTEEQQVRNTVLKKLAEIGVELLPNDESDDGLIIIREEKQPAVMQASFKIDVVFVTGHKRTFRFHPRQVAKQ